MTYVEQETDSTCRVQNLCPGKIVHNIIFLQIWLGICRIEWKNRCDQKQCKCCRKKLYFISTKYYRIYFSHCVRKYMQPWQLQKETNYSLMQFDMQFNERNDYFLKEMKRFCIRKSISLLSETCGTLGWEYFKENLALVLDFGSSENVSESMRINKISRKTA